MFHSRRSALKSLLLLASPAFIGWMPKKEIELSGYIERYPIFTSTKDLENLYIAYEYPKNFTKSGVIEWETETWPITSYSNLGHGLAESHHKRMKYYAGRNNDLRYGFYLNCPTIAYAMFFGNFASNIKNFRLCLKKDGSDPFYKWEY